MVIQDKLINDIKKSNSMWRKKKICIVDVTSYSQKAYLVDKGLLGCMPWCT